MSYLYVRSLETKKAIQLPQALSTQFVTRTDTECYNAQTSLAADEGGALKLAQHPSCLRRRHARLERSWEVERVRPGSTKAEHCCGQPRVYCSSGFWLSFGYKTMGTDEFSEEGDSKYCVTCQHTATNFPDFFNFSVPAKGVLLPNSTSIEAASQICRRREEQEGSRPTSRVIRAFVGRDSAPPRSGECPPSSS